MQQSQNWGQECLEPIDGKNFEVILKYSEVVFRIH